jgi:predicted O-methyltransferase YrrM
VFRALQYIRYLLIAKGIHRAHSAFIFDLFENVLNEEKSFYCFETIEDERKKLIRSSEVVEVEDFGAGSKYTSNKRRAISSIATTALKRPKYARLIFRLITHLNYKEVLELGTSLGVTTSYLSMAVGGGRVETIEGSKIIHQFAKDLGSELGFSNVGYYHSTFTAQLPKLLEGRMYDLIFIDGHHQGDALLHYVEMTKNHLNEGGCFVIDDINWSSDMQATWRKLMSDDQFSLSLDFFEMGLLFKRSGMVKQDHVIRY